MLVCTVHSAQLGRYATSGVADRPCHFIISLNLEVLPHDNMFCFMLSKVWNNGMDGIVNCRRRETDRQRWPNSNTTNRLYTNPMQYTEDTL